MTLPGLAAAQAIAEATPAPVLAPSAPSEVGSSSADSGFWQPFLSIPNDFRRFFSAETATIMALGGAAALAAHPSDRRSLDSFPNGGSAFFTSGNVGGGLWVQAGASFGLYSLGRATGSNELTAVGADLLRAQILTQGIVQAAKFATNRPRPDRSNNRSLPSGHTACAFAGATVLQRHFGWRAGVPAYAFGAYVASARMSANKHHLSDVIAGAAIGIAAARTVTVGGARTRFEIGVSPTAGGAAITFTKR